MIAENYDFAREAANSIYAVSSDEAIRLQCEARERYERDWASSYESGRREGIKEGIEQEQANTAQEKKRADEAEKQLAEARKEIERLQPIKYSESPARQ